MICARCPGEVHERYCHYLILMNDLVKKLLLSISYYSNAKKEDNPQYFLNSKDKQKSNLDFLSINTR